MRFENAHTCIAAEDEMTACMNRDRAGGHRTVMEWVHLNHIEFLDNSAHERVRCSGFVPVTTISLDLNA